MICSMPSARGKIFKEDILPLKQRPPSSIAPIRTGNCVAKCIPAPMNTVSTCFPSCHKVARPVSWLYDAPMKFQVFMFSTAFSREGGCAPSRLLKEAEKIAFLPGGGSSSCQI